MLDMVRWIRFRWYILAKQVTGDTKYGSVDNIIGLLADGIQPFLRRTQYNKRSKRYQYEMFTYDPEQDIYYCPEGQILNRQAQDQRARTYIYRARAKTCRLCPVRDQCTTDKKARKLVRSYFQSELEHAAALRKTETFAKAMQKRKVWVEPMIGEAKQWHRLVKFRLRRLWRVNKEAFLIASVQNIKRLLKPRYTHKNSPDPAMSMAVCTTYSNYFTKIDG